MPAQVADDPRTSGPAPDPQGRAVRLRVAIAGGVAVVAVAAIVALGLVMKNGPTGPAGPLAVAANEQPYADSAGCRAFMAALPQQLGGLARRTLAAGSPTVGAAGYGDPAVVVRCGLADPSELTCDAALTDVSTIDPAGTVSYLRLTLQDTATYLVVDRKVRIAITVPNTADTTAALQSISEVVTKTLAPQPVCVDGKVSPATGG